MRKYQLLFTAFLSFSLFFTACKKDMASSTANTVAIPPDNDNLLMGNPSNAAPTTDSFNNYLMVKPYYDLSYSSTRGTPNWVSWHLSASDLGSASRQDDYRGDPLVPMQWYEVQGTDYSGSGFDRGHNCPSGDRTVNDSVNSATYYMTNMIPQAPNNNENTWANMEDYIRTYITQGYEAYIIMGSYGVGGTGDDGYVTIFDNGHVKVPSFVYKIVVLLPNGNNDLSRVNSSTRVITVDTPNSNDISSDWETYRTSIYFIEGATGYHFLSNLPDSVQLAIKPKVDNQ
jgi:endonuclease G